MECQECRQPLMVAGSKLQSDIGSTDVYSVLTMVCVNPKCGSFCGPDLNNPRKVADIVKNKVN